MNIIIKGRVSLIRTKERVNFIRMKGRVSLAMNEKTIMSIHNIV
jgi:hypothetical protein